MSLIVAYLGILCVLIVALNANKIGQYLGLMDDPGKEGHKSHAIPTPLVGALMVSILAGFIILNQYIFGASSKMIGVSVCTIFVGILGVFDDRLQLGWQLRLGLIAVISMLLVYWVPEMRLTELAWSFGLTTELGSYPGAAFSVLCLMTVVISFNMMDGFNGGVIGFSIIMFVVMALVATNPHRQAICLFLASALGVMFVYNIKGEFFLGDGGAYAIGLLVGAVALLSYNQVGNPRIIYADTIFAWLALPTLDCLRVVITRKLGKNSPFYASRDHMHHILIAAIGPVRTLTIYMVTVAVYSGLTVVSGELTYIVFLAQVLTLAMFVLASSRRKHSTKIK